MNRYRKPDRRIVFGTTDGYNNQLMYDLASGRWCQIKIGKGTNNSRKSGPLDNFGRAVLYEAITEEKPPKGFKWTNDQIEKFETTPEEGLLSLLTSIGAYQPQIPQEEATYQPPPRIVNATGNSPVERIIAESQKNQRPLKRLTAITALYLALLSPGPIDYLCGSPLANRILSFMDQNPVITYGDPEAQYGPNTTKKEKTIRALDQIASRKYHAAIMDGSISALSFAVGGGAYATIKRLKKKPKKKRKKETKRK